MSSQSVNGFVSKSPVSTVTTGTQTDFCDVVTLIGFDDDHQKDLMTTMEDRQLTQVVYFQGYLVSLHFFIIPKYNSTLYTIKNWYHI